jgi:hypothetical protein
MRRVICLGLVLVSATVVAARGDGVGAFEYVRDAATPDAVVRAALSRAADRGSDGVLFVFDTITFDPPPGRNEFVERHRFKDDLPKWIDAVRLAGDSPKAPPIAVAATTSDAPTALGGSKWEARLGGEMHRDWWDDRAFEGFEPAARALPRLVAKAPGKRRTLVLVTGDVTPEKRAMGLVPPADAGKDWRRKLCAAATYWEEEKVGAALADLDASLIVVAPEARFGDFLPLEDVPQAPWASRPQAIASLGGDLDSVATPLPPGVAAAPPKSGRFDSSTPLWFPFHGAKKFFNADSPSAYGFWPFARAAAKTGGAYCFYPFPPGGWADVCPRDPSLVDALAPELVAEADFARLRAGDEALAAMLDAQRIVLESTPWTDDAGSMGRGVASSWCGFDQPGRPAARWRPREKPWDWFLEKERSAKDWKAESARLAKVVADYDRALEILGEAQRKLAAGELGGACRRSQANLRLCRFWFETSAFHLDALRLFTGEIERFLPNGAPEKGAVEIAYTRVFKMSDCLEAYDGRTISPAQEKSYGHSDPRGEWRGHQGNSLAIAGDDPNYRAKRDLDYVFFRLDPRLLPRALRIVEAGADVMAREAKSGWGWVVYYAEPMTFISRPAPKGDGVSDWPGKPDDAPSGGTTPGSGGGGPSTK